MRKFPPILLKSSNKIIFRTKITTIRKILYCFCLFLLIIYSSLMIVLHEYQWSSIVIRSDDLKSSVLSCKGSKRSKSSDTINLFVSINLIFIGFLCFCSLDSTILNPAYFIFLIANQILVLLETFSTVTVFNLIPILESEFFPQSCFLKFQTFKMQLLNFLLRFSLFPRF